MAGAALTSLGDLFTIPDTPDRLPAVADGTGRSTGSHHQLPAHSGMSCRRGATAAGLVGSS